MNRREEIAALLEKRLRELRERDRHVQRFSSPDHAGFEFSRLLERFRAEYRGCSFEEALGARCYGTSGLLEVGCLMRMPLWRANSEIAARRINEEMWLVQGIRDRVAAYLKMQGYATIASLAHHPRFGTHARHILTLLERRDMKRLLELIASRATRGHPLTMSLARMFEPSDLLFLDIETMGLFAGSPVVVVGVAYVEGDGVTVRQWIASTLAAEEALVSEVIAAIVSRPAVVTFNGRGFDMPFLLTRAAYYGHCLLREPVHFDLLPIARRRWHDILPDCRLDTIARMVLGMERGEDIPGVLVPALYREYLENTSGNIGLLRLIVLHNRADMEQLVRLFSVLVWEA